MSSKWIPAGGWLAILGYLILALGVAASLYGVHVNQTNTSIEICQEQNKMRESMIDVFEGQLPPLPIPEEASPDLEEAIVISNARNEALVETFKREMQPLDCSEVD